jgi:hypothetical protein
MVLLGGFAAGATTNQMVITLQIASWICGMASHATRTTSLSMMATATITPSHTIASQLVSV